MVETDTALWLGVIAAGATAMVVLAGVCRRYWEEPGGVLFSATLVALAGTLTALGITIPLEVDPQSAPATTYQYGLYLSGLLWGGFAARRTGVRTVTTRRVAALAAVLTAGFAANAAFRVLVDRTAVETSGVLASAVQVVLALWAFSTALLGLAAFIVGLGLVGYSVVEYEHVERFNGGLVGVAATVCWFGMLFVNIFVAVQNPDVTLATALAGVVSVGSATGFWLGVERYGMFERSVAAGTIGRDMVVEEMEDGVVVVDDEGKLLDVNPVATRLFEVDRGEAVGDPVAAVLGEPLGELRTADLLDLDTIVGVRQFEPRTSPIAGAEGTLLGFSVVLRDVTERRTREERLQVLNRVLRHNLRNEVSVISGYAELLGETGATVALDQAATEITETAHELAEIGEKARTIEQMMAEPPNGPEPISVRAVLDSAVDQVDEQHAHCEFAVDVEDGLEVAANRNVLEPVVQNVVENAAEHNDRPRPHVEIRAGEGVDPTTVTITVVDDGPGIPEDERAVLESGDVTPLEHGSGLGMWITKWGVTRLGGELSFAATEPRGTIVTMRLPVKGPDVEAVEGTTGMLPAD
jgi:signal transduction histidine kinase